MAANKYKSIRQMDDKELLVRIYSDLEEFATEKRKDNTRADRYDAIYQVLDNPQLAKDIGSGKVEDDEALFSNSYMPIGAAVVDAVIGQLFNALFPNDDYFEIKADNWKDEIGAQRVTAHQKKRHREMKFKMQVIQAILAACCFNYCITGTRWLLRPGYVPRRKKEIILKQFGKLKVPYQQVSVDYEWVPDAIDRSDMFVLPYHSCYHDPTSINGFDDSRAFIDQREEMIETLQLMAKTNDRPYGKYRNIDKVIARHLKLNKMIEPKPEDVIGLRTMESRRVTITRYWTPDMVVESAEEMIIWRKELCGWPLQRWGMFPLPKGSFNMMGILQRMERNQYDINATINSRRDYQNLVTDPISVLDRNLLGGSGEASLHPGKTFISDGGDVREKIYIYSPGVDINQGAMADIQVQSAMIEKVTISDNALGAYKGGRRTATETMEVSQGKASKVMRIAMWIEDNCLVPIYNQLFILEQTMLSKPERFRYEGQYADSTVLIRPEDYAWESLPQFYARGTFELLNDPIKLQQFLKALELTATLPPLQAGTNWANIKAHLWSKMAPRDYLNFIEDPRETKENIPPETENMMAAMGQKLRVSPKNDHPKHIASHKATTKSPDFLIWPEQFRQNLHDHIEEHQNSQGKVMAGAGSITGDMRDTADMMRGTRPSIGPGAKSMPNFGGMQ